MRIACFWGEARSLDRISFRHEHLSEGLAALGHSPVLVTARDLAGRFDGPTELVDELDELTRPATWEEFDLAIGVTWLRMAPILEAMAEAGVPRLAIADSDGQLGYAAHPAMAWRHLAASSRSPRELLRALRYFVRRYRASRRRSDPEERAIVAGTRAATRIAFASQEAVACFNHFLRQQRQEELVGRTLVAPFPVPRSFCAGPVHEKENLVVAIGRWSDPQKDAPLLNATLARFLARRRDTRVEIFGADGDPRFGALARAFPQLAIRGVQEPEAVRAALARCRVALFSSRWETGPHAAGEALTSGATLVSPPMPNFAGFIGSTLFGEMAPDRSPRALSAALDAEIGRWDRAQRDATSIAAVWRGRLSPRAYAAALLASVPEKRSVASTADAAAAGQLPT